MAEENTEALQWFRKRLEQLAEQYPELQTPKHQERLAGELRRQEGGSEHGTETHG
jgi:hypothetical protein